MSGTSKAEGYTAVVRWLIFLLPMLACAQAPTGSVHGTVATTAKHPSVRIVPVDGASAVDAQIDQRGRFKTTHLSPGWFVLAAESDNWEIVRGIQIKAGKSSDAGVFFRRRCGEPHFFCDPPAPLPPDWRPPPVPVTSVCEALGNPNPRRVPAIIVGIFKSGMDPTLRQDCPNELRSGDVGWLSAIALSGSTEPPDQYRDQIEKKKAEIYASYPAAAKPRPERLVGLYGILIMPGGLTSAPCCHAAAETTFAPGRLIGINEKDFRVIR